MGMTACILVSVASRAKVEIAVANAVETGATNVTEMAVRTGAIKVVEMVAKVMAKPSRATGAIKVAEIAVAKEMAMLVEITHHAPKSVLTKRYSFAGPKVRAESGTLR